MSTLLSCYRSISSKHWFSCMQIGAHCFDVLWPLDPHGGFPARNLPCCALPSVHLLTPPARCAGYIFEGQDGVQRLACRDCRFHVQDTTWHPEGSGLDEISIRPPHHSVRIGASYCFMAFHNKHGTAVGPNLPPNFFDTDLAESISPDYHRLCPTTRTPTWILTTNPTLPPFE